MGCGLKRRGPWGQCTRHQARLQRRPLGLAIRPKRPGRNPWPSGRHRRRQGWRRPRQKTDPRRSRRSLAASQVDPEHVGPDRQREGRRRLRTDKLRQRPGLEAHPQAKEDPGDRHRRLRDTHHLSHESGADNYMFRVSMVDREQVAGLMAYVKKNDPPRRRSGISLRRPVTDKAGSRTFRKSVRCMASSRFATKNSASTTRT